MSRLQQLRDEVFWAADKLAKWRRMFAAWQLGPAPKDHPTYRAVIDHRELTIMLRAEVSALTRALLEAGVITEEAWLIAWLDELKALDASFEERFKPWRSTPDGLTADFAQIGQMEPWMRALLEQR